MGQTFDKIVGFDSSEILGSFVNITMHSSSEKCISVEEKYNHNLRYRFANKRNINLKRRHYATQKYNPDEIHYCPEYMMDCILTIELVEEPVCIDELMFIEDSYGLILDIV